MVDWLDAHFSERSDSSDEEFVFHEEDAVEDTSDSSEEESGVDQSSVANQNTPQHTYGHHTVNGNSAATNRYASPIQVNGNGNGHGLDENGYTNGKVGANRQHPHLYSPYGRISPRRSNGERVDDDEFIHDGSGSFFPYSDQPPNRPFRELGVPFEIFSDTFNQFHDEQETMLKELKETEQEMLQMNAQLEEEIEVVKEDCNDLKADYRDICEENKQIREYIEDMHSFLIPYFNNIVGADDNDEDNEGVKDMEIDKNNADEDNEEKDDDVDLEFDEVTLGPFLIELFRQQQQQQQEVEQEEQGDEQDQQEEEKQEESENQQEQQGEQEKQRDQIRQ
ncbi:unnamed protein product [Rhizophagus irregularis]|nr:unnamed protein product [Rhizophagus irregularis]CAB4409502.1 unnamed protein product [Rhizophagus irregularis]